jgi:hypothetical protein
MYSLCRHRQHCWPGTCVESLDISVRVVVADVPACCIAAAGCCCHTACLVLAPVNIAGTSYTVDAAGNIVVTACPQDTYGPGMKKQRACVPCPPGYTTNGATGQSSAAACGKQLPLAMPPQPLAISLGCFH